MLNLKSIGTIAATVALCGVVVAPSFAQTRNNQQNRYRYNQRTWQIRSLVDAAERSSNAFRDAVEKRDRQTNKSNRNGNSNRERFFDTLTPAVRNLDEAFERLRGAADNARPQAGRNEMSTVLSRARTVDRYFTSNSFMWNNRGRMTYRRSADLDNRWRELRNDINALAKAYGMQQLNERNGW